MQPNFTVFFRKRKQFFDVFLDEVTPTTFKRRGGGRWGFFLAGWDHPRKGYFGEIHIVKTRVRVDVVQHELDHLRFEWVEANGVELSRRNEEWYCLFGDELIRNFYREYRKYECSTKLQSKKSRSKRSSKRDRSDARRGDPDGDCR